jgi:hypothetical protein
VKQKALAPLKRSLGKEIKVNAKAHKVPEG